MDQNCPRCGTIAPELVPVETGLKVALQATGGETQLPGFVCSTCYAELSSKVSQGMRLRMEQDAKEKNKLMLWKSRVNLIKQGRQLMIQKAYSEAAVCYEKYLRVLEMVYNLNRGQLTPEVFNNSKRSKELTVVASVYWDLMRIYDTSPRYGDRMEKSAERLAKFLPYSPIYPDVVRKAESFARSAKHPQVVRNFLRSCRAGRSGCFIATAAYGSPDVAEVLILRRFRDRVLRPHPAGRILVRAYYQVSPPIAEIIRKSPRSRAMIRTLLSPIAKWAKKRLISAPGSDNP